ncbi:hypothetical protein BJX70DRAFT_1791 [Aspergillus crustosus]
MAQKNGETTRYLSKPEIRVTSTHIYFVKGILSNWHPSPMRFSGERALELCLPQLDALKIPHPAENALSTRLIKSFSFGRGEQWMMALKAWLFERDSIALSESFIKEDTSDFDSFDELRTDMLRVKPLPQSEDKQKKKLWGSGLCRITRTNSPKSQKILGRQVPNFVDEVWKKALEVIVVSGCVARAEMDEELKGLYLTSGKRVFVEGSRRDRVWVLG